MRLYTLLDNIKGLELVKVTDYVTWNEYYLRTTKDKELLEYLSSVEVDDFTINMYDKTIHINIADSYYSERLQEYKGC